MKTTLKLIFLLILYPALFSSVSADEKCLSCHTENSRLSMFHSPAKVGCTYCHAGKASAKIKENAHQNLEAYPGRMQIFEQSYGSIRMPCRVDSAATEFSNEHPRWNDFRNTNGIWLKPKKLFGKPLAELETREALYSTF